MDRLRKAVRVLAVWMTAGMIILAGIPHLDCVCPNGHHKPFCLGSSSEGGCCCGGACCSASDGGGGCCCHASRQAVQVQTEHQSCCGQEQGQQSEDPSAPDAQLHNTGCKRTLAEAVLVAIAPAKPTVPASLPVSAELTVALSFSHSASCWLLWPNFHPPPTDLVVALQHFLI